MKIAMARIVLLTTLPTLLPLGAVGCAGSTDFREVDAAGQDATQADDDGATDLLDSFSQDDVVVDGPDCPALGELAGTYVGTFDGTYSGDVTFSLTKKGQDEFFTVEGGSFSGVATGNIAYKGDLVGTVTCRTFTADIANGVADTGTFSGKASAEWTAESGFAGDWNITGEVQGSGTWTAARK